MRVHADPNPQPITENAPASSSTTAAAHAGSASVADLLNQDQAQFSGSRTQVQTLAAQVLQLPEVRSERVSALRQAIESGSYAPAPDEVAGAIIDHLRLQPAA